MAQVSVSLVEAQPVSPALTQQQAKQYIYDHESSNNQYAVNPNGGACGLGQAYPCSKMPCSLSDYHCEDNYFDNYCLERYGSWVKAYNFWIKMGYW